jgi:hypothetical protein
MVAFGLSTLTLFSDIRNTFWTPHLHAQYAALEAIRSVWEEHSKSRLRLPDLPIYIQDPQHPELGEVIAGAEPHKLTVINCSFGHQMGWIKVDNSTLVMDFMSGFPTFEVFLEIARPVAFFSGTAFEAICRLHK